MQFENMSWFGKIMEFFIQSIDPDAWNPIVKGTCIPIKEVNGGFVPIEWDEMKDDDKRKGSELK